MAAEPHVALEDVARDDFRRQFFLEAFDGEHDALELCFAFLAHVRKYKTLVGRRELLQTMVRALALLCIASVSTCKATPVRSF